MVNARVMRLLATLLIAVNLLAENANSLNEAEKTKVLETYSLEKLEISQASKENFRFAMKQYCLSDSTGTEFYKNYVAWEGVEFLNAVKDFLNPESDDKLQTMEKYFHQLGHQFKMNCTLKDYKVIRDEHDAITTETLFDNFMYDMITRNSWTGINL